MTLLLLIASLIIISQSSEQNPYQDPSSLFGESCSIPGSNECVDRIKDLKGCRIVGGQLNNMTCEDLGIETGFCCNLGHCFRSTLLPCALAGGIYDDQVCLCKNVSSCCFGRSCSEMYGEDDCEVLGGVYVEGRPCESYVCRVQESLFGACCGETTCYDVPEEFCADEWTANSTCAELGCNPRTEPEEISLNATIPGRCCGGECYSWVDEAGCVLDGIAHFEYGLSCTAYPCQPKGVCVKEGYCTEFVPPSLCYVQGGSSLEGGSCNVGILGKCTLNEGCNTVTKSVCNFAGGEWENGTVCEVEQGACCNRGSCYESANTECLLYSNTFYSGLTCDDVICSDGSCCSNDFCVQAPEALCNTFDNSYFQDVPCNPDTGTCSEKIDFLRTITQVRSSVSVKNISLSSSQSSITFEGAVFASSSVTLVKNSSFTFKSLRLQNSMLNIDPTSKLSIGSCLDMENTQVSVDFSTQELEDLKFKSDQTYNIMQYDCITNEPNTIVTVNKESSSCVDINTNQNFISIFYICEESPQIPQETSNTETSITSNTSPLLPLTLLYLLPL